MNPSKKAIIIGGSIGGLFAANLLLRAGWDVHIYEQVAAELEIKISTAKEHIDRVRTKYSTVGRPASTKTELLVRAIEDGILEEGSL